MNGNCNYHGMAQQNAGIIDTVRRHVAELVNPEIVYLLGLGESSRRTESLFTTTSARMRMGSPAPGSTDNSGPIMMPASAANMALSAKMSV